MPDPVSVLFVCLGNICRSTMAEGVFRAAVREESSSYKGLIGRIDSAGTAAYHSGSSPDYRTMATLKANGVTDYKHTARKIRDSDFDDFDYIFAMDDSNLSGIIAQQGRLKSGPGRAEVMLWGTYATPEGRESTEAPEEVEDPYYGGNDGFEAVHEQCKRFSANFLNAIASRSRCE